MRISIDESIQKCQKHIYKYSDGTKLRFDLIKDPDEKEIALLLNDYLWILKEMDKQARGYFTFSVEKKE